MYNEELKKNIESENHNCWSLAGCNNHNVKFHFHRYCLITDFNTKSYFYVNS